MDGIGLSSLRILVYGRIHGVGYRKFVKSVADKYGINGYVRNVYDGSVEILAQNASHFILNRFIDEIKVRRG